MKRKQKSSIPVLDTAIYNVFRDIFSNPEQRIVALNDAKKAYSFIKHDNDYKKNNYGSI